LRQEGEPDLRDDPYLLRRALQEEAAARRAASEPARRRHQEMADAYRLRLASPAPAPGRTADDDDWMEPFIAKLDVDGFGDAEREALAAAFVGTRNYRRRQTIVDESDRGQPLHLVVRGWAARCQSLHDATRQITDIILPGELCDLSRLGRGSKDTVIALTSVRAALLDRQGIHSAMASSPKLAEAVMQLAFNEQAILREWMVCLGRRQKRVHAAHLLCELHERLRRTPRATEDEFDLPLTQDQFADAIGTTAVHANRVLQGLRRDGMISLDRQHLRMLQPNRLKEVGEFDDAYLAPAGSVDSPPRPVH
jgi:CRP-like cAMP-binding protein